MGVGPCCSDGPRRAYQALGILTVTDPARDALEEQLLPSGRDLSDVILG